jgi:succinyl-CoA:acetate CoA-transferase
VPYLHCPPEKIVAVVETDSPDRNSPFKPPTPTRADRRPRPGLPRPRGEPKGRLPKNLLPLQSGVGNIANAVLAGLDEGRSGR